jgi:hypothetical protein
MVSFTRRAFKQEARTGLCGPYAIVNGLAQLGVAEFEIARAAAMVRDVASAPPSGFRAIVREGADRGQMEQMLSASQAWTARQGWPAWTWYPRHPVPHEARADAFWTDLAELLRRGGAAALIGFGDDDTGKAYFEPHWTCIEAVGHKRIRLIDSDVYEVIRRSETAVRPERGWEIEDCFILEASPRGSASA